MHYVLAILLWILCFAGMLVSVLAAVLVWFNARHRVLPVIVLLFIDAILASYVVEGIVKELLKYRTLFALLVSAWAIAYLGRQAWRWLRKHRLYVATDSNSTGGKR